MKNVLPLLTLLSLFVFVVGCEDDDGDDMKPNTELTEAEDADQHPVYYGRVGGTVSFIGSGFTNETEVSIGGTTATVTNVTDNTITVSIPDVLTNGMPENFDIIADNGGDSQSSTFANFRVFPSNTVFVRDGDVDNSTWSSDKLYVLDGYVFVENSLTIAPGTVVMSLQETTTGDNATSLIITRGATIDASGTASDPIIFTSDQDQEALGGSPNLTGSDTKLWAGLIILGNGILGAESDEVQIEGIPSGEDRALYGGMNDNDDSGTLRYVSIRHTGAEIGPGDEIQGLTLGGVGSGTTIEYIDIFASSDDGVEIFGGSVAIRYFSVAYAEDDSYDLDQGWTGYGQYLFALQGTNSDHLGEWDGAQPDDNSRYTNAGMYNATFIGKGAGTGEQTEQSIIMRDGSAISLYNSIVIDNNRKFIQVEDKDEPFDSYQKFLDGEINIQGNICYNIVGQSFDNSVVITDSDNLHEPDASSLKAYLADAANDNSIGTDPGLIGISRANGSGGLNPMPTNMIATQGAVTPGWDSGQDEVTFKGAFDPNLNGTYLDNWSTLARYGIMQ